jgi:hypothetical protein
MTLSALPASKMILFYYPDDVDTNAALGKIAIYHGQLEYILRMTIKSILGLTILDALDVTRRKQSRELRERIQTEARQKLGEGEAFDRLNALVVRSWKASDRRNEFFHRPWCTELDGGHVIRGEDHIFRSAPTVKQLEELASELQQIRDELNDARLHGFLRDALDQKAGVSTRRP